MIVIFKIKEFNLLLRPLATCIDFLNQNYIKSQFEGSFLRLFEFIKKLEGEDFKDKVKIIKFFYD
jgi:hypothetical protein